MEVRCVQILKYIYISQNCWKYAFISTPVPPHSDFQQLLHFQLEMRCPQMRPLASEACIWVLLIPSLGTSSLPISTCPLLASLTLRLSRSVCVCVGGSCLKAVGITIKTLTFQCSHNFSQSLPTTIWKYQQVLLGSKNISLVWNIDPHAF